MKLSLLRTAVVLVCAACAHGVWAAATGTASRVDGQMQVAALKPLLEYRGSYICVQGVTALNLWLAADAAVFSFHAHPDNPRVPSGAFAMQGRVDLTGGVLHLKAVRWMEQPEGYLMVDLEGVSQDGGLSFQGQVTGAPGCSSFSVTRAQKPKGPPALR